MCKRSSVCKKMLKRLFCRRLLHAPQVLPSHVPFAVFREARVVNILASVPTGTHHRYGGEERTVARQVEAQTVGGLEVVA